MLIRIVQEIELELAPGTDKVSLPPGTVIDVLAGVGERLLKAKVAERASKADAAGPAPKPKPTPEPEPEAPRDEESDTARPHGRRNRG